MNQYGRDVQSPIEVTVVEQKVVEVAGAEILAAKTNDGKIYGAVKWICEGIGLTKGQMQSERKRVQEDLLLKRGERNLVLPTNGGMQEVLCIEITFLPMWLAKITITPTMQKESPWTVDRLLKYQLEAKDVLAAAFLGQQRQMTQAEMFLQAAQQMVEVERKMTAIEQRTQVVEAKQENIAEVLSLNVGNWRTSTNDILRKIAVARGGADQFQKVRQEAYQLLEARGHCDLERRLNNRKSTLALRGLSKTKVSSLSKLDVIAEEPRLVEIFLAIVKEMAVAYAVDAKELVMQ